MGLVRGPACNRPHAAVQCDKRFRALRHIRYGSMDAIAVKCAACGHGMKFAVDKAGRKAKCPKCKSKFGNITLYGFAETSTPAAASS